MSKESAKITALIKENCEELLTGDVKSVVKSELKLRELLSQSSFHSYTVICELLEVLSASQSAKSQLLKLIEISIFSGNDFKDAHITKVYNHILKLKVSITLNCWLLSTF